MTFTGTRSYLVGQGEVALIDPGPSSREHLGAIAAALEPGERIADILVTHSHADHSPGARAVAEATGAPVHAFGPHGAGLSETMRRLKADGVALGRRQRLGANRAAHARPSVEPCLPGAGGHRGSVYRRHGYGLGDHPGLATRG
jgi:glyoxylase-like metal-dependent hydrolase (beta-lactamase superfamily II)